MFASKVVAGKVTFENVLITYCSLKYFLNAEHEYEKYISKFTTVKITLCLDSIEKKK